MRKFISLVFILLPTWSFADRLGGLNSNAEVLLTTQSVAGNSIANQNTLQSGATFYVSSGTVNGQFIVGSIPSSSFGNTSSRMVINLNNSSFSNLHTVKFSDLVSPNPDELDVQTLGNDGTLFSKWIMGFPGHGTSLEIVDQGSTYMFQGVGDGRGETVILSSATGVLNLPHTATLGTYGSTALNYPIADFGSSDGAANLTSRVRISHSSMTISVPVVDTNATAGTAGQVYTSNGSGSAATWKSLAGKIRQVINFSSTASSTTSNTSFTPSDLAVTITPQLVGSTISIVACFAGTMASGGISANIAYYTLFRGTTNLGDSTNGMAKFSSGVVLTTTGDDPICINWDDAPNTTSATTYTVNFRSASGSGTVGVGSGETRYMAAKEIGT